MIKLNRRGYLAVEIIVSAVATFAIAFFLIDVTMKLVDTTDDAYVDIILTTDKALITKNIKENIQKNIDSYGGIKTIETTYNGLKIIFKNQDSSFYGSEISINTTNNTINYFDIGEMGIYGTSYQKKIDNSLSNISLSCTSSKGNCDSPCAEYYNFKISGKNIFIDKNYDINIFVYNECIE